MSRWWMVFLSIAVAWSVGAVALLCIDRFNAKVLAQQLLEKQEGEESDKTTASTPSSVNPWPRQSKGTANVSQEQ